LRAKTGRLRTCPAVDIRKATQQGRHRYDADTESGVLDVGAHWRNLANATEPSVCGGDAALYQITLTTYYYFE